MLRLMQPLMPPLMQSPAAAHAAGDKSSTQDAPVKRKRRLLADLCRLIGNELNGTAKGASSGDGAGRLAGVIPPADAQPLSQRLEQTLESLLEGKSEKQVAAQLGLSQHTVHVYVKSLYKKYGVSSRGELLARCLNHRV